MKKLYLLVFALFAISQPLHSGVFCTSVYVTKETIKTACYRAMCCFGAKSIYDDFTYTRPDGSKPKGLETIWTNNMTPLNACLIVVPGIYIGENLATYYEQFQAWRNKKSASNGSSITKNL